MAVQGAVVALVFLAVLSRARRSGLTDLWAGSLVFTSSLFVLRALH